MSDPKLRLDIITIFPDYLEPLRHALLGKAIEQGIVTVGVHNLRDWAVGKHKSVDAPPLGGGPGMVMMPQVWGPALDAVAAGRAGTQLNTAAAHRNDKLRHDEVAKIAPRPYETNEDGYGALENEADKPLLLVPTPAGKPFTQKDAQAWSRERHIVFACGRYEGIDQRVFVDAAKRYRVREVSIGDYVLIGGEVATLVITEAVTRLIPGVLGNTESHEEDSFSAGLLEGPSYTKPRSWRGLDVPAVLLSGDHDKSRRWRRDQSLLRTREVRPELLEDAELDEDDYFTLYGREVQTTIQGDYGPISLKHIRRELRRSHYRHPEISLDAGRIVVRGQTTLSLEEATMTVAQAARVRGSWEGDTIEVGLESHE
ncbi:tRNA (guanosine(37)-N1)-methyltransferase TrmD [Corynebacterium mayonis]|uniref:tRNA (guanosine(37)-N1)-methyltransferase TrmD n=1 Tax=Corynebacterium mayonis TaxID=3062461 RepID=UPI0031404454